MNDDLPLSAARTLILALAREFSQKLNFVGGGPEVTINQKFFIPVNIGGKTYQAAILVEMRRHPEGGKDAPPPAPVPAAPKALPFH